jgi:hypothetical protein
MKTLTCMTAALLAVCTAAAVSANEIRWSADDSFSQTMTIAPGKSAELCATVEPRLPVDWRFSATGPLTFDIHRHSGQDVVYAVRSYLTREQKGKFSPTLRHEWCWMWTNESPESVSVQADLKR